MRFTNGLNFYMQYIARQWNIPLLFNGIKSLYALQDMCGLLVNLYNPKMWKSLQWYSIEGSPFILD